MKHLDHNQQKLKSLSGLNLQCSNLGALLLGIQSITDGKGGGCIFVVLFFSVLFRLLLAMLRRELLEKQQLRYAL